MKTHDIILGFPWLHDAGMILNTRTDEIILMNLRGREQRIPIKSYHDSEEFCDQKGVFCFIACGRGLADPRQQYVNQMGVRGEENKVRVPMKLPK